MRRLGLYVHIPFCAQKCSYCDFYSLYHTKELEKEYINALCSHIKGESHLYKECEFDTIYMGGGTPSILSPASFEKLTKCIKSELNLTQGGEFTVEANPGTLTKEKLLAFKNGGVNRLSIGLQSANGKELSTLGRIHSLEDFERNYSLARECGFDNISVDIMYGLPGQNLELLQKTLDRVCVFSPEHISAYCLKVEENTHFGKIKDTLALPSDEEEYEMYMYLCRFLKENGYRQYEISNFAKEGFESCHNLKYWRVEEYVSFGPASHSFFDGIRYSYPKNLPVYIKEATLGAVNRVLEEDNTDNSMDKMDEYVMLKMRLKDGIDEGEFEEVFGIAFMSQYSSIEKFVKSGHVIRQNGKIYFTSKGFFVSNYILSEILHF